MSYFETSYTKMVFLSLSCKTGYKGDKVEVLGAWVKDKLKGCNEIHPAWKVVMN